MQDEKVKYYETLVNSMQEFTHIIVKHRKEPNDLEPQFDFHLGRHSPKETIEEIKSKTQHAIIVKRIPVKFKQKLNEIINSSEYMKEQFIQNNSQLGLIGYKIKDDTAYTETYDPMTNLRAYYPGKKVFGLGAYLESLVTKHLQEENRVRKISTTKNFSATRSRQVKNYELKTDTPYTTREWLEGIGRGIQKAVKKKE